MRLKGDPQRELEFLWKLVEDKKDRELIESLTYRHFNALVSKEISFENFVLPMLSDERYQRLFKTYLTISKDPSFVVGNVDFFVTFNTVTNTNIVKEGMFDLLPSYLKFFFAVLECIPENHRHRVLSCLIKDISGMYVGSRKLETNQAGISLLTYLMSRPEITSKMIAIGFLHSYLENDTEAGVQTRVAILGLVCKEDLREAIKMRKDSEKSKLYAKLLEFVVPESRADAIKHYFGSKKAEVLDALDGILPKDIAGIVDEYATYYEFGMPTANSLDIYSIFTETADDILVLAP